MQLIIICDAINTLGGVQKFVRDYVAVATRIDIDLQVISRFRGDEQMSLPVPIHYIYPAGYEQAVRDRSDSALDAVDRNSALDTVRSGDESARKVLSTLLEQFGGADAILALQAGSLLQVLDTWGWDRDRDFALVSQYHGTFDYAVAQSYWERYRSALALVDSTVVLSLGDADKFAAVGAKSVTVVPNSVRMPDSVSSYSERPKRAVFVGRLEAEKSIHELIRGWAQSRAATLGWELDIYGDGSEKEALASQIDSLGMQETIHLRGLTNKSVAELERAQLHLLTSHREGMPMSILEANAAGTPTITYDASPGVNDLVIHNSNGRVVPVGDLRAWANELDELLESPELRAKHSDSARHVASLFDPKSTDKLWAELLSSLHSSNKKSERRPMADDDIEFEWKGQLEIGSAEIILQTTNAALPEKAFVVTFESLALNGSDSSRQAVGLPWSKVLFAPFINFPEKPEGDNTVSLPIQIRREVSQLTVRISRWGTRRHTPGREIRSIFVATRMGGPQGPLSAVKLKQK